MAVLMCHTHRYFATALRMLTDGAYRRLAKARMPDEQRQRELYFERSDPREQDYNAAMRFLFEQHDALRAEAGTEPLRVPELCDAYEHGGECNRRVNLTFSQ